MTLPLSRAAEELSAIHETVPGRLRLHVPGLRGSRSFKRALESALCKMTHVLTASGSIATGNILITFDPALASDQITAIVKDMLSREHSGWLDPTSSRNSGAPWHLLAVEDAAKRLRSSLQGLSSKTFQQRLKRHGANSLPSIPERAAAEIIAEQFKSLPVALLLGAAALSVATGAVTDAIVVLSVVTLNAAIGYATEAHSERAIRSLSRPLRDAIAVIRDGRRILIPVEETVLGDLLDLRPGVIVPADARVTDAQGLTVNEATLTGESAPVQKSPDTLATKDAALADRFNMVFRGAIVTGGSGRALVVATGTKTEIGKIQDLVRSETAPQTPLQRQLGRLGQQLTFIALGACGLVLAIGLLRGYRPLATVKNAIALAVAAVPEGLPTLATTTLAIGVDKMRRRHVLVRKLEAVETLASVRVVCLDKTGTLTLNKMTVSEISCAGSSYRMRDGKLRSKDEPTPDLHKLAEIVALCNETTINRDAARPQLSGSATEAAMLRFAMNLGIDIGKLRRAYPLRDVAYRTEGQLFMTTVHDAPSDRKLAAVKGSPEAVLQLCKSVLIDGTKAKLKDERRRHILEENARLAQSGQRVLAAAFVEAKPKSFRPDELTFIGLIGLADPIRPGVPELLDALRTAGVSPVMITGDQKNTAAAIARELDFGNGDLRVVDQSELAQLASIPDVARIPHVFARVTPGQKLEIVKAFQAAGLVVAMTGDGVNDSPALKAADIGIAMGHGGSEAAREVAHIVLENDDLLALVPAIEQGRTTYANIRRAIKYLLSTNMSEILLMLLAPAINLGQPLTPPQLLWINLVTDVLPALALGVEPAHRDVMHSPPMESHVEMVDRSELFRLSREAGLITAGAFSAYIYGSRRYGLSARARTICFMSLVTGQLLHALTCRSQTQFPLSARLPPNHALSIVLLVSFCIQALAICFAPMRRLLGLAPISVMDVIVSGLFGAAPFVANETIKSTKRLSANAHDHESNGEISSAALDRMRTRPM
jgi:Ca2+-transporting ATPase